MKIRSIWRRVAVFTVNNVLAGTKFFGWKRGLLRSAGYQIGAGTRIVGPVYITGRLVTGNDCWIGKNLTIHGNGTVQIGNCCDIAPDVTFLTGGHKIGEGKRRAGMGETYEISVGNGTWIGARSTIMGDRSIGEGVVIAACACVASNVPDHVLVGGVPAKQIKELSDVEPWFEK